MGDASAPEIVLFALVCGATAAMVAAVVRRLLCRRGTFRNVSGARRALGGVIIAVGTHLLVLGYLVVSLGAWPGGHGSLMPELMIAWVASLLWVPGWITLPGSCLIAGLWEEW